MKNVLVYCFLRVLSKIPFAMCRALGSILGNLLWLIKGRDRRVTLKNINFCFPELSEHERTTLARASLKETAKTALEAPAIWLNSWESLKTKILAIEGKQYLAEALAGGKGVVILAPHIGNWEIVGPYLADIAPLTVLYQPFSSPAMDKLVFSGRRKSSVQLAPTNAKGVALLLKALKRGEMVGILPDQLPKKDSGFDTAPFFNQPTLTITLVHSLISRTGCCAISVFAMRIKGGFKIYCLPADERIFQEDVKESLTGLNASVEACVRLAPAQYQWEYNRFRVPVSHRETKPDCCPLS